MYSSQVGGCASLILAASVWGCHPGRCLALHCAQCMLLPCIALRRLYVTLTELENNKTDPQPLASDPCQSSLSVYSLNVTFRPMHAMQAMHHGDSSEWSEHLLLTSSRHMHASNALRRLTSDT
jgi:hypothetical protein